MLIKQANQTVTTQTNGHIQNGHTIEWREDNPVSEHGKAVTEEEYWAHYYEHGYFSYEWNNGILEEKPMATPEQQTMVRWFLTLLQSFLEVHPLGMICFLETAFRFSLPHKTAIRKPDLFVVRHDNPVEFAADHRSYHGICDLAIEAVSDSMQAEIDRDTITKKSEYEIAGVQEYYLLYPGEEMAFYRRTALGQYAAILPDADGVIRSEVLPGFRFRVDDLYVRPRMVEIAEDPIYSDFVMIEYQYERQHSEQERQRAEQAEQHAEQERQHAEQERQRAEQAQQHAEQEHQRAERLAAKLRLLGIQEDEL